MPQTIALPSATHRLPDGRALAYSSVGPAHAPDVLVCLPGLLETRQTFEPVLHAAQPQAAQERAQQVPAALHVVSLDHCGRGDSDPLPDDQGYTMARYLDDVTHLIDHLCAQGARRVHVLGTSMGGILGMYLAANRALPVRTLMLNDVGLSFHWVSIYGLYDGMKKGMRTQTPEEIAVELNVTLGAMLAVQSPTHFDLPYRRDWKGMKFGHLLDHYSGGLRLVHGTDSGVCLAEQVREIQQRFTYARVLSVTGAKHPVPFNPQVCEFLLADLAQPIEQPTITPQAVEVQEVSPSLTPSSPPKTPEADSPSGWLAWIKHKLNRKLKGERT